MRKTTGIAALCLTMALSAAASAQQRNRDGDRYDGPHETERVDRTVSIRAGGQLKLKNFSGRVTITGSNRGDMVVHAVRRAPRSRLDNIKLEITETSSGVTIEANKRTADWREDNNNVVDTEFEIQVPADINLDIDVFSSNVVVKDVRGSQRVKTFSGDVELSGGESSINAETFSGGIEVEVANGASARVEFDTFSGDLKTDIPMMYRSSSNKRIRADIGSGSTDYRFKTFSGDVRIR